MKTVKERLNPFYMAPVAFLIVACLLKGCQQAGMAVIQRNPEPKNPTDSPRPGRPKPPTP